MTCVAATNLTVHYGLMPRSAATRDVFRKVSQLAPHWGVTMSEKSINSWRREIRKDRTRSGGIKSSPMGTILIDLQMPAMMAVELFANDPETVIDRLLRECAIALEGGRRSASQILKGRRVMGLDEKADIDSRG